MESFPELSFGCNVLCWYAGDLWSRARALFYLIFVFLPVFLKLMQLAGA